MTHTLYKEDLHKGEYVLETPQILPLLFEWMMKKPLGWLGGIDTKGALWHFVCEKDGLDSYMDDKPMHELYMQVRYAMAEYEIAAMRIRKLALGRFDKEPFDSLGIWQTAVKKNMRDDTQIGQLIKGLLSASKDNRNLMAVELGEEILEQLDYITKLMKKDE